MKIDVQGNSLVVPDDAHDISVEKDATQALVYFQSSEGTAYLTLDYATHTWDGVLGLPDGSVEFASLDGSFSAFRAIGLDDQPVNPADYDVVDPSPSIDASPPTPVVDEVFNYSLMGIAAIDHLNI